MLLSYVFYFFIILTAGDFVMKSDSKKIFCVETFLFPVLFGGFFAGFAMKMGISNMLNTLMNTAYDLLISTVFYIMAICVLMGAVAGLFSEFGFVSLMDYLLRPLMKPIWGLPGVASLAMVTTFLSDNPAVLTLADDKYYKHFFKRYQFPALTNLGTAFGMGLIICTYMLGQSAVTGESYAAAVGVGLLGAIVGSIVSTRLMLVFTKKIYGTDATMETGTFGENDDSVRPIRHGSVSARALEAILDGGNSGVKMGLEIIPGVLVICTLVIMLTNGPSAAGYTGAAYEGIALLPVVAERFSFVLEPLFGFTSAKCISVPVTALGAAGAAIGLVPELLSTGEAMAGDIAVFTAMCMCWSGYLSTHVSMMNSLHCKELTGKAIFCHTVGGICAGIFANYAYLLICL